MQYIHPPGPKEVFVAAGIYQHTIDGASSGTAEQWDIHTVKNLTIIRVDDGSGTLIHAQQASDGRILRFEIYATGNEDDPIQQVEAMYLTMGLRFRGSVRVDGGEPQRYELVLPPHHIVAPESLIFGGMKAAALSTQPGVNIAIVTALPTLMNDYAFQPVSYQQSAQAIGEETREMFGMKQRLRGFELHNPKNRDVAQIWIDDHDVLVRFDSGDGIHSSMLTQYTRA